MKQNANKWIVDEGHQITGLNKAETETEAAAEMERLGITGSIHSRKQFEKSSRYKMFILGDLRAWKKSEIRAHANSIRDLSLIRSLVDFGVALDATVVAFLDFAEAKLVWVDSATFEELEAYNPATDASWPT